MRDHESNTFAESTSYPSSSRAIVDPSISKNDVYMGNDGAGSIRDSSRLADLGYRPELKRDFSALETFGVAFSIMYVTHCNFHKCWGLRLFLQGCHTIHCVYHHLQSTIWRAGLHDMGMGAVVIPHHVHRACDGESRTSCPKKVK